jgi:AraC-like DNA-binding protein
MRLEKAKGGFLMSDTRDVQQVPARLKDDVHSNNKRHIAVDITEIGYELGFEDRSYFSPFVRREIETSPVEFRNRIREKYRKGMETENRRDRSFNWRCLFP